MASGVRISQVTVREITNLFFAIAGLCGNWDGLQSRKTIPHYDVMMSLSRWPNNETLLTTASARFDKYDR